LAAASSITSCVAATATTAAPTAAACFTGSALPIVRTFPDRRLFLRLSKPENERERELENWLAKQQVAGVGQGVCGGGGGTRPIVPLAVVRRAGRSNRGVRLEFPVSRGVNWGFPQKGKFSP
jgi:hypothetical protein